MQEIADSRRSGGRVSKSNGKLYWYGSGGEILAETNASGATLNEYIFFGGRRVAILPAGGNAQYYVEDFLGSSRVMTTNNGTVCYDADFDPYGSEHAYTNNCPSANAYKFEGKERDTETGNDDFGARYYSNRFGRWLSADWSAVPVPVPYANLTNPQTLNLYSMVADDPESFADLDGHCDVAPMSETATPSEPCRKGSLEGEGPVANTGTGCTNATCGDQAPQQSGQNLVDQIISALNGAAKETLNQAKSFSEMMSPLGSLANALVPDLQPSNSAEKAGMIGDAVALALVPIGGEGVAARATELANTMGKTSDFVTIAVTDTREGVRVVSSSENALRPAVKALLKEGEVAAKGAGHAEVTGVNAAKQMGLTPKSVAASRAICPSCAQFLKQLGIVALSALKNTPPPF